MREYMCQYNWDFNPRSREGSDLEVQANDLTKTISIHAPAKGATIIRQHTGITGKYFNPRSREGSDVATSATYVVSYISIHAPAKGATS